jgi:hypothetical protein
VIAIALVIANLFLVSDASAQIIQRGTATTSTTITTSTVTINKPTGVIAGDVMIANIANIRAAIHSQNATGPYGLECYNWKKSKWRQFGLGNDFV